jgi:hypothetical protein
VHGVGTVELPLGFSAPHDVSVAAAAPGPVGGPSSVAFKIVHDSDTEVSLTLLAPPTLIGPLDSAAVDASTEFSWDAVPGDVDYNLPAFCRRNCPLIGSPSMG